MQSPKSIVNFQRYFLSAHILLILFLLAGGFLLISGLLADFLNDTLPLWENLHLNGASLILGALGIALFLSLIKSTQGQPVALQFRHLLVILLIIHVSMVVMLLWKYAAMIVPDTWTSQVIYLYSIQHGSLSELYSIDQLSHPPFLTPIYPPGYIVLLRPLFSLFGESVSILRLVIVGAFILIAAGLAYASGSKRTGWWLLLAPALFFAVIPVVTWSGSPTKPEFLAAAFAITGFAIYIRHASGDSIKWIVPSSLFFCFALLTKYTIVAGFAAVVLHLLWQRRFREAALFSFIVIGCSAGVYLFLWAPTKGGIAFFTITANALRPSIIRIFSFGIMGFLPGALVVLAITASTLLFVRNQKDNEREVAIALAFILATGWFLVSIGRPGSTAYYFLEPAIFATLTLAVILRWSFRNNSLGRAEVLSILIVAYLGVILPNQFALLARSYGEENEQARVNDYLASLETTADEYVVSDAHYTYDLIQTGHKPLFYDNVQYTLMYDNGIVDSALPLQFLQEGKVPYLVLSATLDWHASLPSGSRDYPDEILDYLVQNYECETMMERWDNALLVICEHRGLDNT